MDHEVYMREALTEAVKAAKLGEVPVGCVIVSPDGLIVGRGFNGCEKERDPTAHAEMIAIREAARNLGDWRLGGCSLYVTLEPCPMCAGGILNARISHLIYGAKEPESGSCGSIINLFMEPYGFSPAIQGGILEEECAFLMRDFFVHRRLGQTHDITYPMIDRKGDRHERIRK